MKAFRVIVTMLSGGVFNALNFVLCALILFLFTPTPPGVNPPSASWTIFVISAVAVYGFLFGLMFGLVLGLFNRDAGFGTAFGAVVATLLCIIFWPNIHTQMPLPLVLVSFVFFISSSALMGFLTIRTAGRLCHWREAQ